MITVTDIAKLADRRLLKGVEYGVYIMQNSSNSRLFLTGVLGEKDKTSALARLKRTLGSRWQYIFFAQAAYPDFIYAAEAILHGRLCEAFRATKKSQFEIDEHDTLEKVQDIAGKAIDAFMMLPQYPPVGYYV